MLPIFDLVRISNWYAEAETEDYPSSKPKYEELHPEEKQKLSWVDREIEQENKRRQDAQVPSLEEQIRLAEEKTQW